MRSGTDVARAVRGVERVYHLAANPNLWARRAAAFDEINHRGAVNVITASLAAGVERLVHVSSESILAQRDRAAVITEDTPTRYEDMPGPYSRSKWLAERAAWSAIARGAPVTIASPTVPIGPGDHRRTPMTRLIGDFAAGRIKARLDADLALIDVRDAAAGIHAAAERGQPGKRYLLAAENWTVARLFDELAPLTGRPAPRFTVPYWLALGFAFGEQWYCRTFNGRVPMATVAGVRLARRSLRFDASATWAQLQLQPRPVRRALAQAVAWLAEQGRIAVPQPEPADE